jgi:hypothetical protein
MSNFKVFNNACPCCCVGSSSLSSPHLKNMSLPLNVGPSLPLIPEKSLTFIPLDNINEKNLDNFKNFYNDRNC